MLGNRLAEQTQAVTRSPDSPASSRYDARIGLGYGTLGKGFHHPRPGQAAYPYSDDDKDLELDSVDIDDESFDAVSKKVLDLYVTDPFAYKSADPFYFAAGNSKLSDCFFRFEELLKEIAAFSDSMSPIPQRSRASTRMTGGGSSFPSGVLKRPRTGSGKGYASSPPMSKIEAELAYEEEVLDKENFSLKDFAKPER